MKPSQLENLKNELKQAVSRHYRMLIARFPGEDFYGYSLYTSDDVSSIGPVANRESVLATKRAEPDYIYYRYSPDEWSDWDDFEMFDQVNRILKQYKQNIEDHFPQFKKDVLGQALQALLELESEGLFGPKDDQRFLVVWLSDSSDETINASAKKLNTKKAYEKYASEFAVG